MAANVKEVWNQLRSQLAADKKKSIVLGVLSLVLLVVIGQLFVDKAPPDAVVAEPLLPAAASAAGPVEARLTRPSLQQHETTTVTSALANTANSASGTGSNNLAFRGNRSRRRAVPIQDLPRSPVRDLFVTSEWHQFAPAIIVDAPIAGGRRKNRDPGGFWAALSRRIAEHERDRAEELQEIDRQVSELELQSTLTGPDSLAHISGHLVRPGEQFRGFLVVQVSNRRVILTKSGVTRQLSMP